MGDEYIGVWIQQFNSQPRLLGVTKNDDNVKDVLQRIVVNAVRNKMITSMQWVEDAKAWDVVYEDSPSPVQRQRIGVKVDKLPVFQ